jgi:hypothetical protein
MSDIDLDFGGVSGVSGVAQGNDERQPTAIILVRNVTLLYYYFIITHW